MKKRNGILHSIPALLVLALCSCAANIGSGSEAIFGEDGTVTYGFYPQTHVSDSSTIASLNAIASASTTASDSNSHTCEDTIDNVYLLSYQDYINTAYFADDDARRCKTTDWARANGAVCCTGSPYQGNGLYWTRSPHSVSSTNVWNVYYDGVLDDGRRARLLRLRPPGHHHQSRVMQWNEIKNQGVPPSIKMALAIRGRPLLLQ